MSLTKLADQTYSTKRPPAMSSGKRAVPAANLTGVKCTAIMPMIGDSDKNALFSQDGLVVEMWETYAQYQTHTDSGSSVTQVPDIKEGDVLTVGSKDYYVRRVDNWPAAGGLLAFIRVVVEEAKNA